MRRAPYTRGMDIGYGIAAISSIVGLLALFAMLAEIGLSSIGVEINRTVQGWTVFAFCFSVLFCFLGLTIAYFADNEK